MKRFLSERMVTIFEAICFGVFGGMVGFLLSIIMPRYEGIPKHVCIIYFSVVAVIALGFIFYSALKRGTPTKEDGGE